MVLKRCKNSIFTAASSTDAVGTRLGYQLRSYASGIGDRTRNLRQIFILYLIFVQ
jgi:hypothetical protein